ncbi:conserved Plasmodium protein, unknown function [Plasmodium ovale curtisi]|uniref:Uncharacterized protein n=1 Tax=Plasmodium ovale curtisi TaxID=864141 RepID=A0A1A8W0Y0_PLAOA|nr:conserved Plasmodium protein, unknown function [Plasmodium ovale curtisi]
MIRPVLQCNLVGNVKVSPLKLFINATFKAVVTCDCSIFRKNCERRFLRLFTENNSVKGHNGRDDETSVVFKEKTKDVFKSDENGTFARNKDANGDVNINETCEDVKVRLFRENLKKYNLFNVYLDKIKKPMRKEKKKKIVNINSVKYFDQCIYLFSIDSLLIYANNKLQEFKKKKKHMHSCNDFLIIFFKVFIQFNKILNDFFYEQNEIKCNECFAITFEPYLSYITPKGKKTQQIYDHNFYLKVLQFVKIFNQINFFKVLKKTNVYHLQSSLNDSLQNGQPLIYRKTEEENSNEEVDKNKLFYEYMTATNEVGYNSKNDLNFINSLKIFDDKLSEIKNAENYFHYKEFQKKKQNCLRYEGKNISPLDNQKKSLNNHSKLLSHNMQYSENHMQISKNQEIVHKCEESFGNTKDDTFTWYFTLVRGFSFMLKGFIKYLNDDCLVRLFVHSSTIFFSKYDIKEALPFFKEIYDKIKQMKNITNKNLAYILNACNCHLKEENIHLLKHLHREILLNNNKIKNNTKYMNIYNIAPSHLENIIYTFSKNNFKEKKIFLLFSEIVKEKCNGFSCIICINILNSFVRLHYETLVFNFLYENIKRFDFITFMMCKGSNIIKLINTLLQIESRNSGKDDQAFLSRGGNAKKTNCIAGHRLTDSPMYVTLIVALLYEMKTFRGSSTLGCGSGNRRETGSKLEGGSGTWQRPNKLHNSIVHIYKRLLRLQIVCVQSKSDSTFLRNIIKQNYKKFDVKQFEKCFVFSFINLNLDKINFHKLIFTLLSYDKLLGETKFTNNYTKKKKKFL